MDLMPQLFPEFPELFAIVDELHHYSKQMVIQVGSILDAGDITMPSSSNYPTIALITTALEWILDALPSISHSFMIMMMEKHRSEMITNKTQTILTVMKPYCRLFFYIIGNHFCTSKLKIFSKTPHHEKTTLKTFILEFMLTLQESDSPLIGMFSHPYYSKIKKEIPNFPKTKPPKQPHNHKVEHNNFPY